MKLRVEVFGGVRLTESDHGDRREVCHFLQQVAQLIGDGATTSGDIKDRNGAVVGAWTYERRR